MTEVKTAADEIIAEAAKRIARAQDQRDAAQRKLETARDIIDGLLRAFVADFEGNNNEYQIRVFNRGLRFLGKSNVTSPRNSRGGKSND